MIIYFPVGPGEAKALVEGTLTGDLPGQSVVEYDESGVFPDARWVAVEVPEQLASRYEDPDSGHLGYREFTFPGPVLAQHSRRDLAQQEIDDLLRRRFVDAVRSFLARFQGRASDEGLSGARHLSDHGEHGEAICTLAWVIVQEDVPISPNEFVSFRALSDGLVEPTDMPRSLNDHVRT